MDGKLIVIEGIDGAGKETQSRLLYNHLKARKAPVALFTYPDYKNDIGKLIHGYLHSKNDLSPEMQFLLYAADMVKDREKISGLLRSGTIVIADRYFTSTMAYQGLPIESSLKFAEIFSLPKPDMIIYLKISPDTSVRRKLKQKGRLDRHEADKEFLGNILGLFSRLIEKQSFGRWTIVNGEQPVSSVFREIRTILKC
ncbi:MAG: dTMP kinase [Candidatus Aenigmarchaeota archaeon]|nr:dTMP kinase [Candidatus Aenigmarchaeota archaeon]